MSHLRLLPATAPSPAIGRTWVATRAREGQGRKRGGADTAVQSRHDKGPGNLRRRALSPWWWSTTSDCHSVRGVSGGWGRKSRKKACPRRESNPHELSLIRVTIERVYQFHHGGTSHRKMGEPLHSTTSGTQPRRPFFPPPEDTSRCAAGQASSASARNGRTVTGRGRCSASVKAFSRAALCRLYLPRAPERRICAPKSGQCVKHCADAGCLTQFQADAESRNPNGS